MIDKVKIGHYTDLEAATGCTVILPPEGNVCSACAFGASPGTRELALLQPDKKVREIHAIVLTGGSAFGLNCAHGVMEELARQGKGYQTRYGVVPIVPASVIFDKNIGDSDAFPTAEQAKKAFHNARFNNDQTGNIGVGTGASVGKWAGIEHAMKSGVGIGRIKYLSADLTVFTAVNAVGDIVDKKGEIIAGAVDSNGNFLAETDFKKRWQTPKTGMNQNTILSVVITNVKLTKTQAFYLAQRVHLAIAKRVEPSHTSSDGDVAFVLSIPEIDFSVDLTASLLIEAVGESIESGVRSCEGIHGLLGYKELRGKQ
ncbi:MAG: P1 family peptidase [Calditrichaeota bacterium]|nr:P1 family peptidase [Calditrichota bacterium]